MHTSPENVMQLIKQSLANTSSFFLDVTRCVGSGMSSEPVEIGDAGLIHRIRNDFACKLHRLQEHRKRTRTLTVRFPLLQEEARQRDRVSMAV